jgi:hypothetical protein
MTMLKQVNLEGAVLRSPSEAPTALNLSKIIELSCLAVYHQDAFAEQPAYT